MREITKLEARDVSGGWKITSASIMDFFNNRGRDPLIPNGESGNMSPILSTGNSGFGNALGRLAMSVGAFLLSGIVGAVGILSC